MAKSIRAQLLALFIVTLSLPAFSQIQVVSPNGGEQWVNGVANFVVTFENSIGEDYFRVLYSVNNGATWSSIAYFHGYSGINHVELYQNLQASNQAKMRVELYSDASIFDESDGSFTVTNPVYYLYYPEEGKIYYHNQQIYLQWQTSNTNPVNIHFSSDMGNSWVSVTEGLNSYYYTFTAPLVNSHQCLVRVSDATDPSVSSLSAVFSVLSPPAIEVTSPNGGEVWVYGQSYTVSWTGVNLGSYVSIKFSSDGGSTWISYGEAATSSTGGSKVIQAPWLGTTQGRIRIADYYYGGEGDMSDNDFTVLVPDFIVYHPYAGESYYTNETFSVDWHAASPSEATVELSLDNGITFQTIHTDIPVGQTYAYVTAPDQVSDSCIFRVSNSNDPASFGLSPVFKIKQAPVIEIVFPNGGEILDNDSTYIIEWTYTNNLPGFSWTQVEFSADSGLTWSGIGWVEDDVLSIEWTTPHETSSNCLIRVKNPYASYISATSAAPFTVEDFPLLQICLVSVDSATGKNIIIWNKAPNNIIHEYVVLKEGNETGLYTEVGSVHRDSLSVFIDKDSDPLEKAGRYKLTFRDADSNIYSGGDFHQTIHLSINKGVNEGTWNLLWNHYLGFNVTSYNIYRGTVDNDLQMIGSVSGNFTSYTDRNAPAGAVYYMVEVVNPNDCAPDKSARPSINYNSSLSNIATNSTLGLRENSPFTALTVYPNPASNIVRLKGDYNGSVVHNLAVSIISFYGQEISTYAVTSDDITKGYDIDVSGLAPGLYTIRISGNGYNRSIKMVVNY